MPMISASRSSRLRWSFALSLILVLLAGALRFYRLDAQSFWNDEGNAARLAERTPALIIRGAQMDIHPPGYYLLLHIWQLGAGQSEFAQRSFSAFCGVLAVAVAFRLGRRAGGSAVGAVAAGLAAVHPLAVYYGQEARMYALLELVTALTLWAAAALFEKQPRTPGRVLALAACIGIGLYTQYTYALVLVGLNLAAGLVWLWQRPLDRRLPGPWIGAHLLGGLVFLPWLPNVLKVTSWRPPDLDAGGGPLEMARALLVGITLPLGAAEWVLPAAGALLVLGLWARLRSRAVAAMAAGIALVPALLIAGLGVYRPAYLKFLMASVVPLGVLLALPAGGAGRGATVRRVLAGALIGGVGLGQWAALSHLYYDPAYQRDDYRGIAARIAAEGRPGEAIILDAPNQWEVFTYYYRGPLEVYPAPYHPAPEQAAAWIDALIAKHPRLFVLYWGDTESDPQRRLENRLAERAYKAEERWVSKVRVALYGTGPMPELPERPIGATVGTGLELTGVSFPEKPYRPGEVVPVTLFWEAQAAPGERLKVFLHLVGAGEQPVAQNDSEPLSGLAPTDGWAAGTRMVDRYGVHLPPDLPAGEYTLWAGMYRFSGERLPVSREGEPAGDRIELGRILVSGP